jgi:quercetin dioxygenase-like cupin family protein
MDPRRIVIENGPDGASRAAEPVPVPIYRFGREGGTDPHDLAAAASADGSAATAGELVVADLWRAAAGGAAAPGEGFDVEVPAGGSAWRLVEYGAGSDSPLHQTATLDHDLVLAGEIELELESGAVTLRAGDAVVIPGLVHAWHTGAVACTIAVLQISLPPSAAD